MIMNKRIKPSCRVGDIAPTPHLTLTFNLPLHPRQIPNWRGAFVQMAGWTDELFHNHNNASGEEGHAYHYRYPLIHYRIQRGQAAIVAIGEGVAALQHILSEHEWVIQWQGKPLTLQVHDLRMNEHYFRMTARPRTYRLYNYIALNTDNYHRWLDSPSFIQRVALVQDILTGHLLGYATAMHWQLPERLEVNIRYIQMIRKVRLHGTPRIAFNLTYDCNLLLPSGIALGKGISHGFGWQKNIKIRPGSNARQATPKHQDVEELFLKENT